MIAVRNSVLPIDMVTYFSEATSDNVSELQVIGMIISDSVVNLVHIPFKDSLGCQKEKT